MNEKYGTLRVAQRVAYYDPKYLSLGIGEVRAINEADCTITIYDSDMLASEGYKRGVITLPSETVLPYDHEIDYGPITRFNADYWAAVKAKTVTEDCRENFIRQWWGKDRLPLLVIKQTKANTLEEAFQKRKARRKGILDDVERLSREQLENKAALTKAKTAFTKESEAAKAVAKAFKGTKRDNKDRIAALSKRIKAATDDAETIAAMITEKKTLESAENVLSGALTSVPKATTMDELADKVSDLKVRGSEITLELFNAKALKKRLLKVEEENPTWTLDKVFDAIDN